MREQTGLSINDHNWRDSGISALNTVSSEIVRNTHLSQSTQRLRNVTPTIRDVSRQTCAVTVRH